MVHLLPGIWWPVDTMAMATANTLTTNWIFFWLKTAFSADLLCLMFVLCLMKKTMVVSWWVGGEKSERLSKCWLRLWRWRCTWNAQTNTSYALGHLGNMDVLWELENVVICNMNYSFFFCWEPGWQKTSWISWKSGYFGTDRLFCWLHWIRSFESQVGRRHCQISRSPLFLGLLNARPPRLGTLHLVWTFH